MALCQLLGNLPNVCTFHGCGTMLENERSEAQPFVVVKHYQNGDLRTFLDQKQHKKNKEMAADVYTNRMKYQFTEDACRGILNLHRTNVVHRDIAARNCLIDLDHSIHVTDFGLSVLTDPAAYEGTQLHKGKEMLPLKYMAPEAMDRNSLYSNFQTDVFMVGYLMYEIWTMKKPWSGISARETMKLVLEGKRMELNGEGIPEEVKKIIQSCWLSDPKKRPSLEKELVGLSRVVNGYNG